LALALAYVALGANDAVRIAVLPGDGATRVSPLLRQRGSLARAAALLAAVVPGGRLGLGAALETYVREHPRPGLAIVVSDLMMEPAEVERGALALGAVGVLVVLHLYGRRRRTVPVGTLFLWQRVPAEPLDRRRFRPDLLFVLQLGVLLALIAGFVRPYLEAATPAAERVRLLVVLDVSASMQAREEGGTRFELARRRARALVAQLLTGDEVMLVTAAVSAHVILAWTADHARAQDRLEAPE